MNEILMLAKPKRAIRRIHFIKEWIAHRHLKQADVVKSLGVNKGTVSKWCSGELPSEDSLLALSDLLHVEPHELFKDPTEDWIARLLRGRPKDEVDRIVSVIETAFPLKNGTTGD